MTPQDLLEQFITERLAAFLGRPPVAQTGAVNPTYPPGDPRYGMPQNFPGSNTPITLNKAEMEGLQRIRRSGVVPTLPY